MNESHCNHFVYITGCDGTGKSTHARLLISNLELRSNGVHHLWLRFAFFFSVPFLAYARCRGYSWSEKNSGVKHGYWDFQSSSLLRMFLPWTYLLDAMLFGFWKVYLPLLRGKTIVCERFVLDMLVDLAVAFNDTELHKRVPGSLFKLLIPTRARVVLLDLGQNTIRTRRPDLQSDHHLEKRLLMFRRLAHDMGIPVIVNEAGLKSVNGQIRQKLGI